MTSSIRELWMSAGGASRVGPVTWRVVVRTLIGATIIGGFLSFVGAFGSGNSPFLVRTVSFVAIGWIGAMIGVFSYRLANRIAALRHIRWLETVVAALLMSPPMGGVIYLGMSLLHGKLLPLSSVPDIFFNTVVMCVAMTFLAAALNRSAEMRMTAQTKTAPKFLGRLPLKLRGAEVWAVEAEDHYLRIHTSKGQDLILLRLADAIAELEGIEGAQVHRSWWVARDAIADARRGDGRATLKLKDGAEVPVSRTYAGLLRDRGWI